MGALTSLAALTGATNDDAGLLDLMAEQLEDVHPRALELAFAWLNKHWIKRDGEGQVIRGTMPIPQEIRELAQSLHSEEKRKLAEQKEADELRELKRQRAEHPGEFFGVGDLAADVLASIGTVPNTDTATQRAKLQQQKVELLNSEVRNG
jgi:hypothetical protein